MSGPTDLERFQTDPECYKVLCLVTWHNYTEKVDFRTKTIEEAVALMSGIVKHFTISTRIEGSIVIGHITYEIEASNEADFSSRITTEVFDLRKWKI